MKLADVETKRLALVICVLVSDLFFTGLVFGWAPLLLMLQEEYQYSELCDFPDMKCKAQENKLNLMFALASVAANIAALPVGMFLDYFGPKIAVGVAGIVEISGLLLMAYSDSQSFDFFVQGYVLLAFGGCITMMASYPSSFLIVKYQTAILAAISCLFDGSSVIFLLLYSIRSAFDISRKSLFLSCAIAGAIVYFLLVYLWGLNERSFLEEEKEVIEERKPLLDESIPKNSPVSDKEAKKLIRDYAVQYGTLNEEEFIGRKSAEDVKKMYTSGTAESQLVDVPVLKQIKTFEFAYAVLFAAIQVFRTTLYIGSTNKLLDNYGDAQTDYLYTKIFSFVLPMGFLFVPAIDYIVEGKGLILSLLFTNGIGVLYNALALIPNLAVQCLTFLLFTCFRAFLYAVMSAFAAKTFGLRNLGTLVGLIFTVSSFISLLEYPAVYISNEYFGGDLSVLLLSSLMLCLLLFPFTECYRKRASERLVHHQRLLQEFGVSDSPHDCQGLTYLRSPSMASPGIRFPNISKKASHLLSNY